MILKITPALEKLKKPADVSEESLIVRVLLGLKLKILQIPIF